MKSWISKAACAAAALVACAGAQANLVTNGDFEAGSLAGWTTYLGANGSLPQANVTVFDTTGAGSSQAATLRVGTTITFVPGSAGISQQFSALGGMVTLSADIATFRSSTAGSNLDAGLFQLIIDGNVLDGVDFGSITTGAERNTLGASTVLTAGLHELRLQITRTFAPAGDVFGYFDNVVVSEAGSVPEPTALALALLAFGAVAAARRRAN